MYLKASTAFRAFYRMATFLYREADYRLAIGAFTVSAHLAVTVAVLGIRKVVFNLLPKCEKLSVFLASLVNIL